MAFGFHNHQRSSRPDEKMGRQEGKVTSRKYGNLLRPTTPQRQTSQQLANRKRRQRDGKAGRS